MLVNRQQIGEVHGVSQQTISDWLAKGLPVLERGAAFTDGAYDVAATIRWRIDQELARASRETPKDRLDLANAQIRELELAQRRGEVIDLDVACKVWASHIAAARARLLSLASAPEVPEAFKATLNERVRQALQELSDHDPRSLTDGE